MSDLYYMIAFTMAFVLFFMFIMTIRFFLMQNEEYHWINFVGIEKWFEISSLDEDGSWVDYEADNTIYLNNIPNSCNWEEYWADKKLSVYCFTDLKESWPGFYNSRWYR